MNGFVYDAIEFMRKYNFDGLDIDWEYPRGPDDRASFVSLIKELRLAFEGEAKSTDNDKLLLTAAVPASFEAIAAGSPVPPLLAVPAGEPSSSGLSASRIRPRYSCCRCLRIKPSHELGPEL